MSVKVRDSGLDWFYKHYKVVTIKRKSKIEFSLTKQEFDTVCNRSCHYCGVSPIERKYNGKIFYANGLDRIDNSKGYIMSNVVPSCKKCNIMKWTMTFEDFKKQCERIHMHLNQEGS